MTRCDYDIIFQRVFCVTLVAIAFTFTVILTNVFVDIDGLLSRKDKVNTFTNLEPVFDNEKGGKLSPNEIIPSTYFKEDKSSEDFEDSYRSKRSLESQNFLFHIRNPKMKGILTSRLATLLEELDEEESNANGKAKKEKPSRDKELEDFAKDIYSDVNPNSRKEENRRHDSSNTEEDLLHLAMHNILLQGIIGHMDLNEVYRKVHMLINNFKKTDDDVEDRKHVHLLRKQATPIKIINEIKERDEIRENIENFDDRIPVKKIKDDDNIQIPVNRPSMEENKFFEEMADCDKLKSDVKKVAKLKSPVKEKNTGNTLQLPNVLIKTIIDITSLNKTHKHDNNKSKDRVKGIIQLIYNGKSVKFSRMDEEGNDAKRFSENLRTSTLDIPQQKYEDKAVADTEFNDAIEIIQEKRRSKSEAFLNKLLSDYLIKDPQKENNFLESINERQNFNAKRYKRQIKIRYQDTEIEKKKVKPKKISLAKTDDDELYVEIETHFDSKGMKGEKKKKLIRNLIDKIQKAIQSDIDFMKENKKKKHKRYHVKKREQHPLDKNRTLFINKVMIPFNNIAGRQSDPISKVVPTTQDHASRSITDKSGENWRKAYYGPGFLAVSKSVNSAELGQVNIDYNKMASSNEIPQRQQQPLNIASSEEITNQNSFFNMGDLKFFVKDLDGTGLSIGFNQYTDEPPDPETMKLFTGIENMITKFHQSEDEMKKPDQEKNNPASASVEKESYDMTRDVTDSNDHHVVIRRSIKKIDEKDYHSNEYRIIFDSNFLPYDNYEEIIEDKNKRISFKIDKEDENIYSLKGKDDNIEDFKQNIKMSELPALMGDNIFYKKLKPGEILNLASMLSRRKRNVNGKKETNIKRKIKMNKFINSRSRFSPKKLILTKKRTKRQIGKIRIIASDAIDKTRRDKESDENIFLVSDENLFADRAMVKDVEAPNDAMGDMVIREQKVDDNSHNTIPYIYDESPFIVDPPHPFTGRFRMNPLMSRYPHIIMEEVSTSNEQFDPLLMNKMDLKSLKVAKSNLLSQILETTTETNRVFKVQESINDEKLNNVESHTPKQNYKLTVKIMPRNITNLNSGYKEIHTSINKSFNRGGKIYSSLFNVSEISKIENLNPTITPPTTESTIPIKLSTKPCFAKRIEEQQEKMDLLLKQHRKRIDEQLEHLKEERNNIETLAVNNILMKAKQTTETTENTTLLPKFDVNQLIALINAQPERTSTTQPTTTLAPSTPPVDLEKIRIINTIRRNENLTNEILQQINKNTEILQTFLMKLSERLPKDTEKSKVKEEEVKPKQAETSKLWKPFNLQLPYANLAQLNDTQPPIPFVYAFQHPYPNKRKPDNEPMANIIYHGLIHTNAFKGPKDNSLNKEDIINHTKYFIDETENGFKENTNTIDKLDGKPLESKNSSSVKI